MSTASFSMNSPVYTDQSLLHALFALTRVWTLYYNIIYKLYNTEIFCAWTGTQSHGRSINYDTYIIIIIVILSIYAEFNCIQRRILQNDNQCVHIPNSNASSINCAFKLVQQVAWMWKWLQWPDQLTTICIMSVWLYTTGKDTWYHVCMRSAVLALSRTRNIATLWVGKEGGVGACTYERDAPFVMSHLLYVC